MNISSRHLLALVALCGAAIPVLSAHAAPKTNAIRSDLKNSVRRAAANQTQITKPGLDDPIPANAPINTIDRATQATMLASVSRLSAAQEKPKDFSIPIFRFMRGAKISKTPAIPSKNTKTNAVQGHTSEVLRSGLRTSNLRKLPMSKSF